MSLITVGSSKMGVDAKRIQVCLLRVVQFSFDISSKLVKEHPLISTLFLLLFIFYFFLPKAFFLLIYSCPFLSCTYIFIRFFWHSQSKNDPKDAKKTDAPPPKLIKKDGKSVRRTHTRSSSSRNMEVKSRELGSEAVSEERKPKIADDDPVFGRAVTTEKKKDSLIVTAGERMGELKSDCGGKVETEISTSEDEEAKECRNKAVEWNEDDQKNLMDLGLSELERNKRLESLIARRRGRKLYKAQTDKNLMSGINASNPFSVAPVSIARSNTFDVPNTPDMLIPGSAPSILLQRNPFDLPYDPFEEKPNLMADSFQQEFMEAHKKELLFCRHESFTLGSFYRFSTTHNDHDIAGQSGSKGNLDERGSDRVVQPLQSEGGGTLIHTISATDLVTENIENSNQPISQLEKVEIAGSSTIEIKGETIENSQMKSSIDEGSEAEMGMGAIWQPKCESSSSSLLENDEKASRAKKAANLTHLTAPPFKFPESPTPSSGPYPLPKARTVNETSYLASPSTIDRSTLENHLLYTNSGPWHTPNDSIASDMQVEVSEVGSPPLTGDGSASSNDGDSLTYDGDVEKEITSGSDDIWGVSPHAPRVEQNLTSREVNELSEDRISRGFSVFQKGPQDSVIQLPQKHQTRQVNYDHISSELHDSMEGTNMLDSSISYTSPQEERLQNLQESMNVSEKSEDEVNINFNLDVPVPPYDDLEDEKSIEVTCDLHRTSIIPENDHDISKPAAKIISESNNHIKSYPEKSIEEVTIAYITNGLAPTIDGTKDKRSVQGTCDLPETSTISKIDHEPAVEMISESINHKDNKPLSSEQSVEEVSITNSPNVPAPSFDDLQELKSAKVSAPKTEVTHDISKPEINSECSHDIESKSLNSLEQAVDVATTAEPIDSLSQSVEVSVPETSIPEVVNDRLELAGKINSECSHHIESKSLNSPKKDVDEVTVAKTIDAPIQSVEVSVPETSKSEVAHNHLELASKINSECSHHIESKSLNPPEEVVDEVTDAETIDAPIKSLEVGMPETSISEVAHDRLELVGKLNSECSHHIESKSLNSSVQDVDEVTVAKTIDAPSQSVEVSMPETSIVEVVHNRDEPASKINSECSRHIESKALNSPKQNVDEDTIAEIVDVPSQSVEITVPETSISKVVHGCSEPTGKNNSECSHPIESKSLTSPEQITIAKTIDISSKKIDDLGDQKLVEVVSNVPETSIISKIARDFSVLAHEMNSGNNNQTESNSLNSLEKAAEEVSITDTNDAPVNTYDDLGEQKSVEVAKDVAHNKSVIDCALPTTEEKQRIEEDNNSNKRNENLILAEDVKDEQNISEVDISGTSKNSSNHSTPGIQQGSLVEQISSSPKSSFIDMDELPPTSSDLNQHMHAGFSESDIERGKLMDQQFPKTSAQTHGQIEQHEIVTSIDRNSQMIKERSNTLTKTIDNTREMLHASEAFLEDEKEKEDLKSTDPMHDEAVVELSNLQPDAIESNFVDHIKDTSGNPGIQQTKPEEQQGEFENLTEHKNTISPSKPAVEDDLGEMPSSVGEQVLLYNSTAINHTVADEISTKDPVGVVLENEGESQGIDGSSHANEIPNSTVDQDNSLESMKGTKSESRNSTEDAVGINQLEQSWGISNSNHMKHVEDPKILQGNESSKDKDVGPMKSESKGTEIDKDEVTTIDQAP